MTDDLPIGPREVAPDEQDLERRLMERIRLGDESALDEMLRLHWRAIARFAARISGSAETGEDIAQQTFLRVWERRAGWKPGGSPRSHLFKIARNLALNERRRDSVRSKWREIFRPQDRARPITPEQAVEGRELEDAIAGAMAALPVRRREVFELVRFHSLSYQEVAEIMGISAQTVANQASAAFRSMREALLPYSQEAVGKPPLDTPIQPLAATRERARKP